MGASISGSRTFLFREAVRADHARIVEFQLAMAWETEKIRLDPAICSQGVQAVFERSGLGRYFVAERDGVVIASLLITFEWSDWRNGMIWWIQSLYVVPEARGGGVFSGLYAHLKAQIASDPTLRGIRLYVDRSNTRAQQVYAKVGMDGDHYSVFEWMTEAARGT